MKHLLLGVGILLASHFSCAQTEQLNMQKYWKFRDALRENFVKIARENGGSIVARALLPNSCYDNIADSPTEGQFALGEMHFGDGMIRQGYYISLLATEYKLLKDAEQDTRGVLNELYYALEAINRLDLKAEAEQSFAYGFDLFPSLNGFYQREDIPQNFAMQNWQYADMQMYCVNSPHSKSNNALGIEGTMNGVVLEASPNSYQNVPSLDQMSSLMMGFRLVHKLVDNVYVQPTAGDPGHYLVTETQAIVNRMMTFLNEHNWMMIDVNGWPVNNGGGDAVLSAYPLEQAAYIITGNHYDTEWNRRVENFWPNKILYCVTGNAVSDHPEITRQQACNRVYLNPLIGTNTMNHLMAGADFGENNNQDNSVYQEWLADGNLSGDANFLSDFWSGFNSVTSLNDFFYDLDGDSTVQTFPVPFNLLPLIDRDTKVPGSNDGNLYLLASNVGIAGNLFTPTSINHMTNKTGNKQLDLMQAVLEDETPVRPKTFFDDYFNSMPISGPYNFKAGKTNDSTIINTAQSAPNGWAAEDRWTWSGDVAGGASAGSFGIFNSIDYMLAYNLYRIAYNQPAVPYGSDQGEECLCSSEIEYTIPDPLPPYTTMADFVYLKSELDAKLAFIPTCTENVLDKVNNVVSATFNIEPYFAYYSDLGIYTNEFETEDASIVSGGYVNVNTNFILCSQSTLTMTAGSIMKINKRHVSVNDGSTLDVSGDLYVQGGTELRVKTGGRLILRPNSKLILHENCSVIIEPGATLIYYPDAKIYTKNETGYLVIKGNLNLEDNATFTIDHSLGAISGCVVFEGSPQINAKAGAKILLNSKGKDDPILAVKANTVLKFSDPDLAYVRLENCGIDLSEPQSSIRFEQPVFTKDARFFGDEDLAGKIIVTDINRFSKTDFHDMHISGLLNIENKATLNLQFCNFTQGAGAVHNGSGIFVTGRNYNIRSCNFAINAGGNAVIESEALTMGSIITECSFNSTNEAIGEKAVYDFSNTQLKISKSDFNHLQECVHKSMGTLSLKCNRFIDTYQTSVIADKYCFLNMSVNQGAGYNTFTSMTGTSAERSHILLVGGEIYMDLGLNYFSDVPVTGGLVRGKVSSNCASTANCLMDFGGNQWGTNPASPPVNSNRFFIRSMNNIAVTVTTASPVAQAVCGTYGGPHTVLDPVTVHDPVKMGAIPKYYSAVLEDSVRLDEGIDFAIASLSSISDDSTGNDLRALELFNEIFSSSINYFNCTPSSKRMLEIAESNMKIALESLFDRGDIDQSANISDFEYSVEAYANAVNKMTLDEEIRDSYGLSFQLEMKKAHLLRLIGHSDKALDVLIHLEDCGVDLDEQVLVNAEKTNAYKDQYVQHFGTISIDTPFVMDNKLLISPVSFTGPYHFGTFLQSLNVFNYSHCHDPKSLIKENHIGLVVFPNPARNNIQFQIKSENLEGVASLKIIQTDGRIIFQKAGLNMNLNEAFSINTSLWSSGAYHYSFVSSLGETISGVFIVE